MSMPPILTSPSALASGMVSCMRLRQRTKVDLPQPEGPITAVAWFASTAILIPCSASVLPNQAFKPRTSTAIDISAGLSCNSLTEHKPYQRGCADDHDDQQQSASPGLPMPIIIRRIRVHVD